MSTTTSSLLRVKCSTCKAMANTPSPDDLIACPSCGKRSGATTNWGIRVKIKGETVPGISCSADCQTASGVKCRCECGGMSHGTRA